MLIYFKSKKLEKQCNDDKEARRAHGDRRAGLLRHRLDDLAAAATLAVMRPPMPGRCHELTADRSGQLALDLDHPYRLIFDVADDPIPKLPDGSLDWSQVRSIRILEIVNYHD